MSLFSVEMNKVTVLKKLYSTIPKTKTYEIYFL